MDIRQENLKDEPELARTLGPLIAKIMEYKSTNQDYGDILGKVIFGVNGNMASKMRLIGETIIKSARIYGCTPKYLIDSAFEGDPDPDVIVLRLNTIYGNLHRECTPGFLSYSSSKANKSSSLEDAEMRILARESL